MQTIPRLNLLPQEYQPARNPRKGIALLFPAISHFMSHVDKNGPLWNGTRCWIWTAGTNKGYGYMTVLRVRIDAHLWYWRFVNGPIPNGYEVDHLCRRTNCVNIDHLEAVPQYVNNMRSNSPTAVNARKTHCSKGHLLHPDNIVEAEKKRGWRDCKMCALNRNLQRSKTTQTTLSREKDKNNELSK